jgi:glycosyltransferase 2 family protein
MVTGDGPPSGRGGGAEGMQGAMPDEPTDDSAPLEASTWRRLWRRWGWVVRWTGTLLGVLYVATLIDVASLGAALVTVSFPVVLGAAALTATGQVIGAVRWRTLLSAYGAESRPDLATAVRLYFVAVFYNSFLPGAVAGDVVRAVVTRTAFEDHGATGALAVVFIERILGLFAVFVLVLAGVALSSDALGVQRSLRMWSIVGCAASLACILALPAGRGLARFLPGPIARIARRLPSVVRLRAFATAVVLSLCTQGTAVIAGWLILRAMHPGVTLAGALLIVPAAVATACLPITVGGIGAREAAFVVLCGRLLGMASEDAVAASLLLWLSTLIIGAVGGVLLLIGRGGGPAPAGNHTSR